MTLGVFSPGNNTDFWDFCYCWDISALIWSRPGDLGQTSPIIIIIIVIISQTFLALGFQREPNLTLAFFSPLFHPICSQPIALNLSVISIRYFSVHMPLELFIALYQSLLSFIICPRKTHSESCP